MNAALLSITVFLHATIVDGTDRAPIVDGYLEVHDGIIAGVGSASGYRPPGEASVLDAANRWIIPGLIDTHTHLIDSGSLYTSPDDYDLTAFVPHEVVRRRIRERMPFTLDRYLCSGVTTLASLGGPRWELDVKRQTKAPRVLTAGPFFANFPVGDVTLWTKDDPVLVQIRSPDEARARVREVAESGVDLVKVGYAPAPGLGLSSFAPILKALVEEAHGRGLRVAMHAEQLEVAKLAVRSGVDVLAHTIVDRPVDDELLHLAKAAGTYSITGLAHFERYRDVLEQSVSLLPIEERCGDPDVIGSWAELREIPEEDRPPMPEVIRYGASPEARRILLSNVKRLFDAGIPIATGSNGGNVGTLQGPSLHREFRMMAEAGLPPRAVLLAATRDAARALGVEATRGTLEVGKAADFLVLSKDPLESVENLEAIERVYVGGTEVWPSVRKPAEPMSYLGANWLEREFRQEDERPDLVVRAMALEPGDIVADVGTGTGYYARRMAPLVAPQGKVYAVDIQPKMLEILAQLADKDGVKGILPVLGEPSDPKLPSGEVDWILLADVYHELASPQMMLSHLYDALAPDGRVALVEYRTEDGTADHVKADHVMSVRQVLSEWGPEGFELVELHEYLPTQHLFVFGKRGSGRIEHHDLFRALDEGLVEAEVYGSGDSHARVRIRRRGERSMVITLPVGTTFVAEGGKSDLISRRDGAVRLFENGWQDWMVRALRRTKALRAPGENDRLALRAPLYRRLSEAIQRGTFRVEDSPLLHAVRTQSIEQAALWIADQDVGYDEMLDEIGSNDRVPPEYAAAFALVFCDLGGIDVTSRRIWDDAPRIFGALGDQRLKRWYELRSSTIRLAGPHARP